jgi:hypothetical protein
MVISEELIYNMRVKHHPQPGDEQKLAPVFSGFGGSPPEGRPNSLIENDLEESTPALAVLILTIYLKNGSPRRNRARSITA